MQTDAQFTFEATRDESDGGLVTNMGGIGIRATHVPTGLSVTCDLFLSGMRNRQAAREFLERVMHQDGSLSLRVMAAVRWISDSGELNEMDIALLGPASAGDGTLLSIDEVAAGIVRTAIAVMQCEACEAEYLAAA